MLKRRSSEQMWENRLRRQVDISGSSPLLWTSFLSSSPFSLSPLPLPYQLHSYPLLSSSVLSSPSRSCRLTPSRRVMCYGSDAGLGGQTGSAPLPPVCLCKRRSREKERPELFLTRPACRRRKNECVRRKATSALLMKVVSFKWKCQPLITARPPHILQCHRCSLTDARCHV